MKKLVLYVLFLVSCFAFAGQKPNLRGADVIQHGVCSPDGMQGRYYCFIVHKNNNFYLSVWQADFNDVEMKVTPKKEIKIFNDDLILLWEENDV